MSQRMPAVSRPPSGAPNGGKITGQQRTVEVVGSGLAVPGVRVQFSTGKGNTGSVFLPETNYSPESAIAAARQAANIIDQVHEADI